MSSNIPQVLDAEETRRCGGCRKNLAIVFFTRSGRRYAEIENHWRTCNYCKIRGMRGASRPSDDQFAQMYLGLEEDGTGEQRGQRPDLMNQQPEQFEAGIQGPAATQPATQTQTQPAVPPPGQTLPDQLNQLTRRCGSCRQTREVEFFSRSSKPHGPIFNHFRSCNYCKYRCMKQETRPSVADFARMYLDFTEADINGDDEE